DMNPSRQTLFQRPSAARASPRAAALDRSPRGPCRLIASRDRSAGRAYQRGADPQEIAQEGTRASAAGPFRAASAITSPPGAARGEIVMHWNTVRPIAAI